MDRTKPFGGQQLDSPDPDNGQMGKQNPQKLLYLSLNATARTLAPLKRLTLTQHSATVIHFQVS